MYTLKSIARRGTALGSAAALVVATLIPTASVFADSLNPLTERSLTLSSSSPGWTFTDGSGNSTYAPPNSGANGQKTGNYFDFKVTTPTTPVKTMSFQYCTTSAGNCEIPGNDSTPGTDTASTSDLNANFPGTLTDLEIASGDFSTVIDSTSGTVKAVPGYVNNNPKYQAPPNNGTGDPAEAAKNVAGNYVVMYDNGGTWTQSTGWKIEAVNRENADTGAGQISRPTKNYLVLTNTSGRVFSAGQRVKVLFFATGSHYITNPGAGAFFVKINTYNKEYVDSGAGAGQTLIAGLAPTGPTGNIIDGGVTVANVMNQSIQITTKVLETMEFSVGTVDPDSLSGAELAASDYASASHIPCGRILTRMTPSDPQNVLQMGNQGAESSLETAHAYATHSYWRLSSNSSGGATVYYSGHTLSNTSGDEIKPIGNGGAESAPGSEQFGLGIASAALSGTTASPVAPGTVNFNTGTYGVNYAQDRGAPLGNWENGADNGKTGVHVDQLKGIGGLYTGVASLWDPTDTDWDYTTTPLNASYHTPRLDPLEPLGAYGSAAGRINGTDSAASVGATNATFAFDKMSDTVPRAIASEPNQVVDCVTAKMRYVGNIAATTPAGIYTTKVNYIAAPQY